MTTQQILAQISILLTALSSLLAGQLPPGDSQHFGVGNLVNPTVTTSSTLNGLKPVFGSPLIVGGSNSSTITGDGTQTILGGPLNVSGTITQNGAGLGTGNGTVTTSTALTTQNFPFWVGTAGALAGTSSLSMFGLSVNNSSSWAVQGTSTVFGAALFGSTLNASGSITQNGVAVATGTSIGSVGSSTFQLGSNLFISSTGTIGVSSTITASSGTFTGLFSADSLNATTSARLASTTFSSLVSGGSAIWTGTGSFSVGNASTSFTSASTTLNTQLTIPLNPTYNVNGQVGISNTTATMNFFASSTQFSLNPELCDVNFTLEISSSTTQTQEDDYLTTFKATSTITKLYSVMKSAGDTATFNIIWNSTSTVGSRTEASSTERHLFSGAGVQGNVTSTQTTTDIYPALVAFASSTVNAGSVMRLVTNLASSTQWGLTLCYTHNP